MEIRFITCTKINQIVQDSAGGGGGDGDGGCAFGEQFVFGARGRERPVNIDRETHAHW